MASNLPSGWEEQIRSQAAEIIASTPDMSGINGISERAKVSDNMTSVNDIIELIRSNNCDTAYQYVSHARTEPDQEPLLNALLGDTVGGSYIEMLLKQMCPDWTPPSSQEYSQAASVSGGKRSRNRKTRNRRNKRRGASKKVRSRK
jgi:hypothetical protein